MFWFFSPVESASPQQEPEPEAIPSKESVIEPVVEIPSNGVVVQSENVVNTENGENGNAEKKEEVASNGQDQQESTPVDQNLNGSAAATQNGDGGEHKSEGQNEVARSQSRERGDEVKKCFRFLKCEIHNCFIEG